MENDTPLNKRKIISLCSFENPMDMSKMIDKINYAIQSNLFLTSLFITKDSLSDINLQGIDLLPLKFPLYNRIFT